MKRKLALIVAAVLLVCTIVVPNVPVQAANTNVGSINSAGNVVINYSSNTKRIYKTYTRSNYNGTYGTTYGDSATSVATVLSGLISYKINPETVHKGTDQYSETYAIRKLSGNYDNYDTVTYTKRIANLSLSRPRMLMVNEILKNAGLTTKYVRTITDSSAAEVEKHLAKGYPVIFATEKTKSYQGIRLTAEAMTSLAVLGLDANGKAIVVNPVNGKENYSDVNQASYSFTATEIIENFAVSAGSNQKLYNGVSGGYILVYPTSATTKVESLTISKTSGKLNVGEKQVLNTWILPATTDQSVTWKSSDTSVASVSDGVVTALKAGSAAITATSKQNASYKATYKVTVYSGKEVTNLSVKASRTRVGFAESLQLKLSYSGGKKTDTISWTSSDTSKATVSSAGLVKGKKPGDVKITAKVGEKSKSITLKVTNYSPAVIEGDINTVKIYTSGGKIRTYQTYNQEDYNGTYGELRGCAITSTAIVLNALVSSSVTPKTVHQGTSKYSEKYAIKKLGKSYTKYDSVSASARTKRLNSSTPTNFMMQKILTNAGLKTKYVKSPGSNAVKEITNHLKKGNPVIFTTHRSRYYKGVNLALTWHTLVMVGLDADNKVIVINPKGGTVNYSHTQEKVFHFTVSEMVKTYLPSSSGSTKLYSGNRYGYILVWK